MTYQASRDVFGPKTKPMINILASTHHHKLDVAISYSSVSSLWANVGQANYSCANRILDNIAMKSNNQVGNCSFILEKLIGNNAFSLLQGRNHHVINWGPWSGVGMAAALNRKTLNSEGIFPFDPKCASEIFSSILNYQRLCQVPNQHLYIRLSEFRKAALTRENSHPKSETLLKSKIQELRMVTKTGIFEDISNIRNIIRKILSALLQHVPDDSSPLMTTGLDSLGKLHVHHPN